MSNYQHRPGYGSVLQNDRKTSENSPDFTGDMMTLDGNLVRVAMWWQPTQQGIGRFSIKIQPPQQQQQGAFSPPPQNYGGGQRQGWQGQNQQNQQQGWQNQQQSWQGQNQQQGWQGQNQQQGGYNERNPPPHSEPDNRAPANYQLDDDMPF